MDVPTYAASPAISEFLHQGEILSDLIRFRLDAMTIGEENPKFLEVKCPFAVVLTQACDLAQHYADIQNPSPQLPNVLFCQLSTATELSTPSPTMNKKIWDKVRKNKDERYHFLEAIPSDCDACGQGLPEMGIDFKRYFTLPIEEVYLRIKAKHLRRRSVLCSPYLEHLSSRFAYFMSRVGLPRDHESQPADA